MAGCTAHLMHGTPEAKRQREEMGFHEGWGICFQQLEDYACNLV
ncbi:SRPBCC family protein [Uliginosibacterium aquaticum]|nr:hypothetical protein [Uliginosibacterium aquaticum]